MESIIVRERSINFTRKAGKIVLSQSDFDFLAYPPETSAPRKDPEAGRKFYTQLDRMLSQGAILNDIKPAQFTDLNINTVSNYLSHVRKVINKRECPVNPLTLIRAAGAYGCMNVLARLCS